MMLAHYHGQIWNAAELARPSECRIPPSSGISTCSAGRSWCASSRPGTRTSARGRSRHPRSTCADSGLLHALLGLRARGRWTHIPRSGRLRGVRAPGVVPRSAPDRRSATSGPLIGRRVRPARGAAGAGSGLSSSGPMRRCNGVHAHRDPGSRPRVARRGPCWARHVSPSPKIRALAISRLTTELGRARRLGDRSTCIGSGLASGAAHDSCSARPRQRRPCARRGARAPVGETATPPVIVSGTAIDERGPPPVPDGVIVGGGAGSSSYASRPVGKERAGLARVDDLLDVKTSAARNGERTALSRASISRMSAARSGAPRARACRPPRSRP